MWTLTIFIAIVYVIIVPWNIQSCWLMWWPNLRKNQTRLSGGLFPFQTECILEFFLVGGWEVHQPSHKANHKDSRVDPFYPFCGALCFFWATVQALEAVVTRWGTWNFAKVQAEFDQAKGPQHRSVAPGRSKFYGPCCGDFSRLVWFVEVHRHI